MNNAFAQAFDAIQTTLGTAAEASLKRGRDVLPVICASGVMRGKQYGEPGRLISKLASVRFKSELQPDKPFENGDLVELVYQGANHDLRVDDINDVAGLVRLTLIAEFE